MGLCKRLCDWYRRVRTLHECRNCGATLEEAARECPNCGSQEIATYELDGKA